jgi:hypothetical protein
VAATPPACLLAAINTQPNPADLGHICGQGSTEVLAEIKKVCNSDTPAALSAFTEVCKGAGYTPKVPKPSKPTTTTKKSSGHQTGGMYTSTTTPVSNGGAGNGGATGGAGGATPTSATGGSGGSAPTGAAVRVGGVGGAVVAAVAVVGAAVVGL